MKASAAILAVDLIPDHVAYLPIAAICPDPNQPRTEFNETELQGLATDIAARGIEHALLVQANGYIKDGERRWRAAQIAKLATVPCLLAIDGVEVAGHDPVAYLLDQAADNDHAAKLTPLDWARFLKKLVETHGVAVKDIPALLAARGITMSRPYASNLMRLTELPDWAQDKIKTGALTPAHGKHLLIAKDSPKALAEVKSTLENWDTEYDPLTIEALRYAVLNALDDVHLDLECRHGDKAPQFDTKTCEGCPNRKVISEKGCRDRIFCFDETCFNKKQTEAVNKAAAKKKQDPTAKPTRPIDPKTRERQLRQKAETIARRHAVLAIVGKANGHPDTADMHLLLNRIAGYSETKQICERRGWQSKNGHFFATFATRTKGLGASELHGLLLEAALANGNDERFIETAKRYHVNLKALEKTALAELMPKAVAKKPKVKKSSAAAKPKGKKK